MIVRIEVSLSHLPGVVFKLTGEVFHGTDQSQARRLNNLYTSVVKRIYILSAKT